MRKGLTHKGQDPQEIKSYVDTELSSEISNVDTELSNISNDLNPRPSVFVNGVEVTGPIKINIVAEGDPSIPEIGDTGVGNNGEMWFIVSL